MKCKKATIEELKQQGWIKSLAQLKSELKAKAAKPKKKYIRRAQRY